MQMTHLPASGGGGDPALAIGTIIVVLHGFTRRQPPPLASRTYVLGDALGADDDRVVDGRPQCSRLRLRTVAPPAPSVRVRRGASHRHHTPVLDQPRRHLVGSHWSSWQRVTIRATPAARTAARVVVAVAGCPADR